VRDTLSDSQMSPALSRPMDVWASHINHEVFCLARMARKTCQPMTAQSGRRVHSELGMRFLGIRAHSGVKRNRYRVPHDT